MPLSCLHIYSLKIGEGFYTEITINLKDVGIENGDLVNSCIYLNGYQGNGR